MPEANVMLSANYILIKIWFKIYYAYNKSYLKNKCNGEF